MAKYRMCTCVRCNKPLDRNIEEFVSIGSRWAHKECDDKFKEKAEGAKAIAQTEREKDIGKYHDIMDFVKNHFDKPNYALVQKQLKEYLSLGYSQSGILKSLIYYYDIKKNPTNKGAGGIGAVKICYNEAREYYHQIYLTELKNKQTTLIQETEEIKIKAPEKNIKKKKLFMFLEEGKDGK